ncbi:two-component sensor histidine kinase BarA [Vibrio sp. WXL103]|uniref:two-component sensor histidine kinase BarA n=1 Tax=Vibrio sp. WXL103 TaxID=3450710 RepID=UPI003EC71A26
MTRYGLRARVITLTLAPTLIIGLLLCAFFSFTRYHDLERQVINSGLSIIEPMAIASEDGMMTQSRESVRRIISYAHRKNSRIVRSIAVFDSSHELFVTSNFHPQFQSLTYDRSEPIPLLPSIQIEDNTLILRAPIIPETRFVALPDLSEHDAKALGYISMELDLSSLRLQQYREIIIAISVMILGLALSTAFALRLMHDVTRPIDHMREVVGRIRRGHVDVRIDGKMHGELDSLKNGINAMAESLSAYHTEMQHSIDQATSDLRETLEQLEIQNVELDIAKKRAQEAARVKSEFLANMSHELRTPLNGVIGFSRQMLKTQLTASQTDYLQTIEKSANNLLSIINDILDFSKLEAGKLALENIPFDFQESLEEVVSLQATSAHEKGLELTLKIDPKIPAGVVGDPLRIQQVLTNLVGNSIKFTDRGNIDISVELRSQKEDMIELQFMVRDTGIGISERQQAQLFQAFSQADASISRRYGGTGLGLVITQKLVSQMGGEISLTSRLHQGSTFWYTIQLATTNMPVSDLVDTACLANRTVLLVEPNIQAATVVQQMLSISNLQVSYRSTMPDEVGHYDYAIINFAPNTEHSFDEVREQVILAQKMATHVSVGLPSTELALATQITAELNVPCVPKPFSRRKLLQNLVVLQPELVIEPVSQHAPKELLPLTVMAVDDNSANLKLISALLQERVKTVVACNDGIEAVECAQQEKFDIILMDIQMPRMDGVTACKAIKTSDLNGDTPIIAVTAHAMQGERERLLDAGMDDYLTKPIEEHILQQVLVRWNPNRDESEVEAIELEPIKTEPLTQTSNQNLIIDWQLALKQSANKQDLAKDMLRMLIEFIPEVSEVVDSVLDPQTHTQPDLLHFVHKLNGSCSYSGVPRLKKVCAELEKGLRSDMSIEDLEPELFELQDEMEKVIAAAEPYLA